MSDRLDEIRARLEAATSGPWRVSSIRQRFGGEPVLVIHGPDDKAYAYVLYGDGSNAQHAAAYGDASLIAHAPTDIRYLLDENDRLRALELEREKNLQRITELGQEIELLRRDHADGLKVTGVSHDR